MKKVALLTTIFPMPHEYLIDFFDSLIEQTFKIFDIYVVNDGFENFDKIINSYRDLNIYELEAQTTLSKNREYGINYIKNYGYDILIFADSDDFFCKDRIEKSVELLREYDIVVNDFIPFYNKKMIQEENKYISNRLDNRTIITQSDILEKNIFGLSNTAINLYKIQNVNFDEKLIVVDWYFFSCLLSQGLSAIFTSEVLTYYRQHENNIIGIQKVNKNELMKLMKIKKNHYALLKMRIPIYEKLYNKITLLEKLIESSENKLTNLEINKIKFPLWWEETKLIEDIL